MVQKPAAGFFKRALVIQEIMADRFTPVSLFESLSQEFKGGTILESGLQEKQTGRFSFLAFEAFAGLELLNKALRQYVGEKEEFFDCDPVVQLRRLLHDLDCACPVELRESITQSIGFMGYDAVRLFEEIPDRHARDKMLPEMAFHFYKTMLTFDHQKKTILVSCLVDVGDDPEQAYQEAQRKIAHLVKKISSSSGHSMATPAMFASRSSLCESDTSDVAFIKLVERAQEYIQKGDAFQIVLSRCFKKTYNAKPFDIYRALRQVSPAPYMFYLPLKDRVIIGASPERMLSVCKKKVSINPIAGTRQRLVGLNKDHDQKNEESLLSDEKELAEHRMLVDLARNDLGRVCDVGTVRVEELARVTHYSHVSHLTSVVTGTLGKAYDFFDALAASFPAGTLSGAPKIRAMQIIDELENSRRGLYGGTIGRLDYAGNFDSCISIRMASLKDGVATIRAGAGIVYDSIRSAEAEETRQKASSLIAAINFAEGGC